MIIKKRERRDCQNGIKRSTHTPSSVVSSKMGSQRGGIHQPCCLPSAPSALRHWASVCCNEQKWMDQDLFGYFVCIAGTASTSSIQPNLLFLPKGTKPERKSAAWLGRGKKKENISTWSKERRPSLSFEYWFVAMRNAKYKYTVGGSGGQGGGWRRKKSAEKNSMKKSNKLPFLAFRET